MVFYGVISLMEFQRNGGVISDFGLARIKVEGAPRHPDEIDYEHGEECPTCSAKYKRQLDAYLKWEQEYNANNKTDS